MVLAMLVTAGCSEEALSPPPQTPPWSIPWVPPPPSPPLPPPSLTVDELLAAPDSLLVDGMRLSAQVELYRDFMPFSPPEGRPLVAYALLNGSPPDSVPPSVSVVYSWVIRDSLEVWSRTMSLQMIDPSRNGAHIYQARDGPLWGPGITVDVVIGVRTSPAIVSLVLLRGEPILRSE